MIAMVNTSLGTNVHHLEPTDQKRLCSEMKCGKCFLRNTQVRGHVIDQVLNYSSHRSTWNQSCISLLIISYFMKCICFQSEKGHQKDIFTEVRRWKDHTYMPSLMRGWVFFPLLCFICQLFPKQRDFMGSVYFGNNGRYYRV